jgi:hypothetical protein
VGANFSFDLDCEGLEIVFGCSGEPTDEEIRDGCLDHQPLLYGDVQQEQRYVTQIKNLTLSYVTQKDTDVIGMKATLERFEISEESPNEDNATIFRKIFFWRKSDDENQSAQATLELEMDTKEEQSNIFDSKNIPSVQTSVSLDIQHSSLLINLDTQKRMILALGQFFATLNFMEASDKYQKMEQR